jgi:hypothetical protein
MCFWKTYFLKIKNILRKNNGLRGYVWLLTAWLDPFVQVPYAPSPPPPNVHASTVKDQHTPM